MARESDGDEVRIASLENDYVEIRCGRSRFKMMALDPRSFPAMPAVEGKAAVTLTLPADALAAMIDQTAFAISPDETRYNLSGIYVHQPAPDTVRFAATDGHRLAYIDRAAPGFVMERGAILPRKGLAELRKLLAGGDEVTLTMTESGATLKQGQTEIAMRLVEGEFPDYKGVVPTPAKVITVERAPLIAALKRVSLFSSDRYRGVRVALTDNLITLTSTSPELGEASDSVDVAYQDEAIEAGFNAAYLLDALGALSEETVAIGLTDEVSPITIAGPEDSPSLSVVMPMVL